MCVLTVLVSCVRAATTLVRLLTLCRLIVPVLVLLYLGELFFIFTRSYLLLVQALMRMENWDFAFWTDSEFVKRAEGEFHCTIFSSPSVTQCLDSFAFASIFVHQSTHNRHTIQQQGMKLEQLRHKILK